MLSIRNIFSFVRILFFGALPITLAACGGGAGPGDAKAGETLVSKNACGSCHQSSNMADGVLSGGDKPAANSMIYGPNITPDKATGIGDWTDEQIKSAITTGVDDEGKMLCSIMPRFGTLSEQDVADITAYLRSLPAVNHTVPDGTCP